MSSLRRPLVAVSLAIAVIGAPALSYAQDSSTHATRAQVRAELIAAEQAGALSVPDTQYPSQPNVAVFSAKANVVPARPQVATVAAPAQAATRHGLRAEFHKVSVALADHRGATLPDSFTDLYRGG